MSKDKNHNNTYYWRCEKHDTLHVSDHNHVAEVSRSNVIRTINALKERGRETSEPPAQIIQTVTTSSSHTHPYLPSRDVLQQSINRTRSFSLPIEPETLDDLVIFDDLTKTPNGSVFWLEILLWTEIGYCSL
ncbi:17215_t:CDS:2 [Funneliformis caledonium]|uniref:17215_t:CDS:1 n=1 Tax=Funneliformis caledonium TaxID=1117310 RepID=A0A9N9AYG4_9GLOM|nr:17215_t:CDS:2 [Funneliformis caledonium]